jgi:SWIM zinc finger
MVPQANPGGTPLTPIQSAWLRALAKARALGTAPEALGGGHYRVIGSQGDRYTVVRTAPDCTAYSCDCPAGREGRPCYHAAAVASLPYEAAGRAAMRRRKALAARKARAA